MNYFDILLAKKLNGGGGGGDITVESLSVTENGTYTAPSGKAYNPVTVEVAPPEDSYQLKSITTPTSLATFEASNMPMPTLKVSVDAKQDLHGYDKPWVGGAGKNKLPLTATTQTINGVTFTPNSDGTITVNGTATGHVVYNLYYADVSCPYNGYILSGCPLGGSGTTYDLRVSDVTTTSSTETGTGTTINLTDTGQWSAQIIVRNGVTVNNLVFKPMIRLATETDPTFEPYSNICPISGWDEANVSDVDDVDNPTVTQTTTISLPQTVYGAEVDVVNGGMTVDRMMRLVSDCDWYGRNGLFYTDSVISSIKHGDGRYDHILSDTYKTQNIRTSSSLDDGGISVDESGYIQLKDTRYSSATDFKTAMSGVQLVYELATPTTFETQPTPIKSLNGQNNLSVDCGDVIEGEYFIALGGE